MSWQVNFAPEVEEDVTHAAEWYEQRREGLGAEFVEEIIAVCQSLADSPFLNSRRHSTKHIRWRYPDRFPYRVIYEVDEPNRQIYVAAVLHAAMDEHHWLDRV